MKPYIYLIQLLISKLPNLLTWTRSLKEEQTDIPKRKRVYRQVVPFLPFDSGNDGGAGLGLAGTTNAYYDIGSDGFMGVESPKQQGLLVVEGSWFSVNMLSAFADTVKLAPCDPIPVVILGTGSTENAIWQDSYAVLPLSEVVGAYGDHIEIVGNVDGAAPVPREVREGMISAIFNK